MLLLLSTTCVINIYNTFTKRLVSIIINGAAFIYAQTFYIYTCLFPCVHLCRNFSWHNKQYLVIEILFELLIIEWIILYNTGQYLLLVAL